jgi:O-antigen ligase
VVAPGRFPQVYLPLTGIAIAALWPLTANSFGAVFLPGVLALASLAVVTIRRPEYGIAVVLALSPFYHLGVSMPDPAGTVLSQRPLTVLLPAISGLVLFYGLLVGSGKWQAVESRRLLVAALIFVGALFLSTAHALNPSEAGPEVSVLLTGVLLFVAVVQICERRDQLLIVFAGVLIALCAASLQGVIQHYSGDYVTGFAALGSVFGRVQGSFDHPNQFATFIASLAPLAGVVLFNRDFPRPMRLLSLAALVLAVPALVFTYSRGSLIAVVLGAIVWLAFLRPRAAIAVAVVIAVTAIALAPTTLRERFDPDSSHRDLTERVDLWNAAIAMYSEHPVLGVGINNYSVAYPDLPRTPSVAPEHRLFLEGEAQVLPTHAHNLYLNTLAEEGIVGAIALLVLIGLSISAVYRGSRVTDSIGRSICIGIGISLMTFLIDSFVDATLFTEAALPLFALLGVATVFIGLEPVRARSPRRETGRESRRLAVT